MLSVIGIGPGSQAMMTVEATEALQAADIVVGYKTYTHLVKAFTGDKQVIKTGMCKEIERCQAAIELAQAGRKVALISSGDAGIYGMAGLVLELVTKQQLDVEVRLIPGMTASIAAAALLGVAGVVVHDGEVARTMGDQAVDQLVRNARRAKAANQHRGAILHTRKCLRHRVRYLVDHGKSSGKCQKIATNLFV